MLVYTIRRVVGAIPTILIVVTLAFFMMRIAPGGPFDRGRPMDPTVLANLDATFGFDEPLWRQYLIYLVNLAQGDMGPSFIYRDQRVAEIIGSGLPVSMLLGGLALTLAVLLGPTLGSLAALRQNSISDYAVSSVATFGITIPNFVAAPILSLVFGVMLGWLPAQGWGDWRQLILPIVALSLPFVAIIARLTRGAMIEALRSDHVRTARAYGLPAHTVVLKHALRAAFLPVAGYLGPAAASLLTGSIVIEQVFNLPGIGRHFVQGAINRDYTLVMGTVVVIAVFVVLFNLMVDLLYSVLDPRVRYD